MKRKKILAVLLAGSLMVPFASSLTFGEDILVGEEAPVFTDGEIGYEEPVSCLLSHIYTARWYCFQRRTRQ